MTSKLSFIAFGIIFLVDEEDVLWAKYDDEWSKVESLNTGDE
jgi:hypothetical protein